jgi:hypothetical protein
VTATLFLNWSFSFQAGGLWLFCPLPLYALLLSVFALLLTGLFFIGPALATRAAGRSLFLVIEDSLGAIPAWGLRLCCVSFLVLWMATLIALPTTLLSNDLERRPSSAELGIVAAAMLMFLFFTGLQNFKTRARLAAFTNKLGLAILIAALIRVHEGWPALLGPFRADEDRGQLWYIWEEFSMLAFYVAPLALLAADLGHRSQGRRQVAILGLMGVALPLFVVLFLVGVIGTATYASGYYQPSLEPTVAMALWSKAARSALPGRVLVAAVTAFGAVRFGGRSLLAGVSYGINSNFAQDKDDKRLSTNRCVYTEWARPFSSQSLSSFEIDAVSRPLYICDQWLYAQAGEGVRSFGRRLERVVYTPASP